MILWLAALGVDLVAGEPPAWAHPVVWMGRAIARLAAAAPDDPRAELRYGVAVVAVPAAAAAFAGAAVRLVPSRAVRIVLSVWLLKASFSLRALLERTGAVEDALARGDIERARDELRHLVSRPRAALDAPRAASAAIESACENLADSYVAPLLWYLAGGLPLALAYRAVNTADAMVGYHGAYERLGKASARVDDALGYVPARCAAGALVVAAPVVGLDGSGAAATALRDHRATESPNAGWTMAAAAGALGVRLEKTGHYRLGDGRAPRAADIRAARALVLAAAAVATSAAAVAARR